jgi:hypothetical protein
MFSSAAAATPIPLNSGDDLSGITEFNNLTGANVLITPHPAWRPNGVGLWVSYANTGYGQTTPPPNSTTTPLAIFYEVFTLPTPSIAGSVTVWADDTAAVFIDGVQIWWPNFTQGTCAAGPIGCEPNEGGAVSLAGLPAGQHTLRIDAYQVGGVTFGVLYEGWVEPIPEPLTLTLIGTGLVALGLLRRRVRR